MAGVTVGFSGWADWQLLSDPVQVALGEVGLWLDLAPRSIRGGVSGKLTIGSGSSAGTITLNLILPARAGQLTLQYEPSDDEKPTLDALVRFLSDTWSLPEPVAAIGRELTIARFTVQAGAINGIELEAQAFADRSWPLVPGNDGLSLHQIFVRLTSQPAGALGGTLNLGDGQIPLIAELRGSWSQFSIELNREANTRLPDLGDIADLFDRAWRAELPASIADLGTGLSLNDFQFERFAGAWTLLVKAGAAPGWSWKPIPEFSDLTLTGLAVELSKPRTGPVSGKARLAARVAGIGLDLWLAIPEQKLTGRIEPGRCDLGQLAEYVTGEPAPDWLRDISLNEVRLELGWRAGELVVAADLAREVTLPDDSKLVSAVVTAQVSARRRSVCLQAEWVPALGGPGIKGEICFPFREFRTPRSGPRFRFPPSRIPPVPNPPVPPPILTIRELVIYLLALGAGIAAIALACALSDASAQETAEAILIEDSRSHDLLALAAAIRSAYNYEHRAQEFLEDLLEAIRRAGLSRPSVGKAAEIMRAARFSVPESAQAIYPAYHPTIQTMISSLQNAWPGSITAAEMTRALAGSGYLPVPCAGPIQSAFQLRSGPAFVGVFAEAGFSPPITTGQYAQMLRDARFDVTQAIDGLVTADSSVSLAELTGALASAGYPATDLAPALMTSRFAPQVATAAELTDCLLAAYRELGLDQLLRALARSGFPVYLAGPAALPRYGSAGPEAISVAITTAYPGIDPLSLAVTCGSAALGVSVTSPVIGRAFRMLQADALRSLAESVSIARFPGYASRCVSLRSAGVPVARAATDLVDRQLTLTTLALTALLHAIYAPDLDVLAAAVQGAVPGYQPPQDELALLLTDLASIAPRALAVAYQRALSAAHKSAGPVSLAGGLVSAYRAVSRRLPDAVTLMRALDAAFDGSLTFFEATQATRQLPEVSATDATQALAATFTSPPIMPTDAAIAVTQVYRYPHTEPADVAISLAAVFGLRPGPTAAGAIALALSEAAYSRTGVLAVLPDVMTGWTARCAELATYAYGQDFDLANRVWLATRSTERVAQEVQRAHRQQAGYLLLILVAVTALVIPGAAAAPVARGLKAGGYDRSVALACLEFFFGNEWTPGDTSIVDRVYGE